MITHNQGLFRSEVNVGVLESLFTSIGTAVQEDRLQDALRLADRSCRLAPANATCLLLHARLLIRLGAASEAVDRLRDRDEPDAVVARAEALCLQQAFHDAAAYLEDLLRRFAVDSVENLGQLASRLCRSAGKFPGWIGTDSSLRLVGEIRHGIPLTIAYQNKFVHPTLSAVNRDGMASFAHETPAGVSGRIDAFSGHRPLLGSGFKWPPEFGASGWVTLEDSTLVGKVRLEWAPTLPTTLAIAPAGFGPIRQSVGSAHQSLASAFSLPLDGLARDASHIEVSAVLPDGTHWPLCGSPLNVRRIKATPIGVRPKRDRLNGDRHRRPRTKQKTDVVVPVYAGAKETLACLERVLATTPASEAELVVVNDASPDAELCEGLARLARGGRIAIIANTSNLGFPGSANRGLRLHPERDVVLLNSDAEVSGDWLDRLQAAAYSAADVGTVTPLGEAASIMSYPGGEGPRTPLESVEIDRIARELNADKWIDLPVGVGFCFYLKRACLDEVGTFDENSFGKGYGEENDFCLRARRHGWRHLGAANIFVGHPGGRSFGPSKKPLMERNSRVLNSLHPGYDDLIAKFVASDPLLTARRAIDTHRLLKQAKDPVLLVTFDATGGVKRHVDLRQSELSAGGHTVLVLQPSGRDRIDQVALRTHDSRFENLAYNLPEDLPPLRDLLSKLGLWRMEVHHFMGLPAGAIDLVTSLGVRYDVYVHDYSWICPRLTLIGGDNVYCGEPAVEDCETCIRSHGTELEESLTVAALRTRSGSIMQGANHVIAPTEDVRTRLSRYFPNVPVKVKGWEAPAEFRARSIAKPTGRIRVAVIGAISIQKGYRVLLECARDAARRGLDLDFVVIGYSYDDAPLLETGRIFITGPYAESETAALLEREGCHIVLFPTVAPETWCYALTHAIASGLPIVAFDLGAIPERLRGYGAAQLLPFSTNAPAINDSLLEMVSERQKETQKEFHMTATSPAKDAPASQELETTAKILTLPVGVYSFTVQGGASNISSEELAVPALQLGLAPMKSPGMVEFLAGAGTLDRWLTRDTDSFIVRIFGDSVSLLLTSVRFPSSPVLTINVQRIDTEPPAVPYETNGAGILPAQILAHIENFGDIYFNDSRAGFNGQKLRVEAFAILSVGQLEPQSIEYCGMSADGYQTPWLSNRMLCGSRGRGMPLTGYAIRLKPELAERFECTYTGRFVSGTIAGPFQDGQLCCSTLVGDALEGLELRVAERVRSS